MAKLEKNAVAVRSNSIISITKNNMAAETKSLSTCSMKKDISFLVIAFVHLCGIKESPNMANGIFIKIPFKMKTSSESIMVLNISPCHVCSHLTILSLLCN
ncbi:hypothetical protein ACV242_001221 [Peribacillus simplex]